MSAFVQTELVPETCMALAAEESDNLLAAQSAVVSRQAGKLVGIVALQIVVVVEQHHMARVAEHSDVVEQPQNVLTGVKTAG